MRKHILSTATTLALLAGPAFASESLEIGVVNFATCISDSKHGKKEQESFESLRGQMASLIENTEKELKEIASKFEDTEYLDSLSPKAEEELKMKYQSLQEDLGRYQGQFYQVLNQANYQMMQKMSSNIANAAEKVAKQKKLGYIMNKEACFYISPDLDITNQVISEMDKTFELDVRAKKKLSENSEAPSEMSLEESGKQAG